MTNFHETWYMYVASWTPIKVCSNDDPGMTLTYYRVQAGLEF